MKALLQLLSARCPHLTFLSHDTTIHSPSRRNLYAVTTMAKGKKVKRHNGGGIKQKQAALIDGTPSSPTERNVGFIETPGGPERVLPPEIRDKIFRYLLVGVHVKTQWEPQLWKTKGYADYYRFEVNVLRVNRAFYAAAKNILYRENTFIVLSTREPGLMRCFDDYAVPVVSQNMAAVNRFSAHSLFLRFEGPLRAHPRDEDEECDCRKCRASRKIREERTLLLSDDLPAFIRICRVRNHMDPDPTFAIVDCPRNGAFSYQRLRENRQQSSASIRFTGKFDSTTAEFVEQTLALFRKVVGDRHVEIVAPSHPILAADCQKAMMPKVVWGYAIGWDLVEVARELKAEADKVSEKQRWSTRSWAIS